MIGNLPLRAVSLSTLTRSIVRTRAVVAANVPVLLPRTAPRATAPKPPPPAARAVVQAGAPIALSRQAAITMLAPPVASLARPTAATVSKQAATSTLSPNFAHPVYGLDSGVGADPSDFYGPDAAPPAGATLPAPQPSGTASFGGDPIYPERESDAAPGSELATASFLPEGAASSVTVAGVAAPAWMWLAGLVLAGGLGFGAYHLTRTGRR